MFWLINIIGVFLLCIVCAGIIIPQILLIAFRRNLFDEPDERKIHTSTVPRLGGMAFMPVIFFSIALIIGIDLCSGASSIVSPIIANMRTAIFCCCALTMLYIVGIGDDLIGIRYRAKFVIQILCAAMLIAGGLSISNFHGFLWINQIPWYIAWPFTVLLIVFIINAINLIDGIDGLASGLSSVGTIFYGVIFYFAGEYFYAMLSFATLGVLLPFFYYNVFGNPQKQKKIFMGDTGSLTIGLLLCILSFKLINTNPPQEYPQINILISAMSPLVIPCFDVVRVYLVRIKAHNNPFLPDKNHIHHRLLALGLNQRQALLCILAASVALTVFNAIVSLYLNVNLVIVLDIILWMVGMEVLHYLKKKMRNMGSK